jgi:hypothetical protein
VLHWGEVMVIVNAGVHVWKWQARWIGRDRPGRALAPST